MFVLHNYMIDALNLGGTGRCSVKLSVKEHFWVFNTSACPLQHVLFLLLLSCLAREVF